MIWARWAAWQRRDMCANAPDSDMARDMSAPWPPAAASRSDSGARSQALAAPCGSSAVQSLSYLKLCCIPCHGPPLRRSLRR